MVKAEAGLIDVPILIFIVEIVNSLFFLWVFNFDFDFK